MNSIFNELNNLKLKVKDCVLSNQNLLKLLRYDLPNPLDQPDVDNPQEMIDKYIYLRPRAYDTQLDTQSVLLVRVAANGIRGSSTFADLYLSFVICVHNDISLLEDDNDRMCFISDEINSMFNNKPNLGLGKMVLADFRELKGNADYVNYQLSYKVTNYNK